MFVLVFFILHLHRRLGVTVPQQFLNGSDVVASLKQMCGKGMPEGVAGGPFGEPGLCHGVSVCRLASTLTCSLPSAASP